MMALVCGTASVARQIGTQLNYPADETFGSDRR
jgi:hypothetical protein